jgi:hypothetical protein
MIGEGQEAGNRLAIIIWTRDWIWKKSESELSRDLHKRYTTCRVFQTSWYLMVQRVGD